MPSFTREPGCKLTNSAAFTLNRVPDGCCSDSIGASADCGVSNLHLFRRFSGINCANSPYVPDSAGAKCALYMLSDQFWSSLPWCRISMIDRIQVADLWPLAAGRRCVLTDVFRLCAPPRWHRWSLPMFPRGMANPRTSILDSPTIHSLLSVILRPSLWSAITTSIK